MLRALKEKKASNLLGCNQHDYIFFVPWGGRMKDYIDSILGGQLKDSLISVLYLATNNVTKKGGKVYYLLWGGREQKFQEMLQSMFCNPTCFALKINVVVKDWEVLSVVTVSYFLSCLSYSLLIL